jgi:hypothetical protein
VRLRIRFSVTIEREIHAGLARRRGAKMTAKKGAAGE